MTGNRRRNCIGCGRWLQCGDAEVCTKCDPECWTCGKRQSEAGALAGDNCAECVTFIEEAAS